MKLQGGQEARQARAQDIGHARARLLGRVSTAPGLRQHDGVGREEGHAQHRDRRAQHRRPQVSFRAFGHLK